MAHLGSKQAGDGGGRTVCYQTSGDEIAELALPLGKVVVDIDHRRARLIEAGPQSGDGGCYAVRVLRECRSLFEIEQAEHVDDQQSGMGTVHEGRAPLETQCRRRVSHWPTSAVTRSALLVKMKTQLPSRKA